MLAVILQQGLCFQGPPGEKKQSQSWHPMPYASVLETNHILIQCLKKKISKLWPWTICLCLWIKFYWNPFFFHWNDSNSYWDRVYYVPWSFIHEASPPSPHPRPGPAPYPLTHHSLTHPTPTEGQAPGDTANSYWTFTVCPVLSYLYMYCLI